MAAPTKYQHAIKEGCPYEATYGASFHTVKKWSKLGYPLDDTEATLALIASQQNQPRGKPPGHDAQQPGHDHADTAPKTRQKAPVGSLGLAAAIDRLSEAERQAHGEYLNAHDPARATAAFKRWIVLNEQLRKAQLSNPEIEESNKQTVKLPELKQTLAELFIKLRQDLDTMPKRIAIELIGKDEIGIREVLQREAEQIISSLYNNKYLEQG